MNLGIVVSEFNYDISQMMLQRAKEHAKFLGVNVGEVIQVPGAFDMPLAVKKLLEEKGIDGVATLGAILEGDTDHDTLIAQHAARKIMDLSLEFNKPVGLGITGPKVNRLQAQDRIDDYARRSIETVVKLNQRLKEKK
ncbi:MAG: 6,7-dimethyl-8-ribityllumazine synthase [Candidatus Diapherotrites archaeon]